MNRGGCDNEIVCLIRGGQELLREAQQRQQAAEAKFQEAYTLLYQAYAARATGFARARLPDWAVEDIVQETFAAAWKSLPSFRGSARGPDPVWGWFAGILVKKIADFYRPIYIRRQAVPRQLSPRERAEALLRQYFNADLSQEEHLMVHQAFNTLNERHKLILRLYYTTGLNLSEEQIAAIVGVLSPPSVRMLKKRALAKFMDAYRSIGGQAL